MSVLTKGGLIVSCQALKDEPLYGGDTMAKMAYAAEQGGAKAIRANTVEDILAIRNKVKLPVVGLIKEVYEDSEIYITPTIKEAEALIKTGCEVIATDATLRPRPHGETLEALVQYIRTHAPSVCLMADIATEEEAARAEELGFDYISSTLRGYTKDTCHVTLPDIKFVKTIAAKLSTPIIAEGGIWTVEQLDELMRSGAYAAVIGQAITRPQNITARFNQVMEKYI